jgi:PKD domain
VAIALLRLWVFPTLLTGEYMRCFFQARRSQWGAIDELPKNILRITSFVLLSQLIACGGGGYDDDNSSNNPNPGSNPPTQAQPVAAISAQQNVKVGNTVTVDGSQSTVDSGQTISYAWTFTAPNGSQQTLADTSAVMTSFTPDIPGQYQLSLTVSDGQLTSNAATTTVQADNTTTNSAPNAAIFTSTTTPTTNTPVVYSAMSSNDPDQDNIDGLTFAWTLTAPTASNTNLDSATNINGIFTPDTPGDYTLSLVVTDANGLAGQQVSTVVTSATQPMPYATFSVDTNLTVGNMVNVNGEASVVPDNFSYTWAFIKMPTDTAPDIYSNDSLSPSFTPQTAGEYVLKLSMVDAQMKEVTMAQQRIYVMPAGDTANLAEIMLLGAPDNPVQFSRFCGGAGDVILNGDDGSIDISFNQNLVADGNIDTNTDNNSITCQVKFSLLLPDGIQLRSSQSTLSGSENGNTFASNLLAYSGTTPKAASKQFNQTDTPFQLSSPVLQSDGNANCGGQVDVKALINIIAIDGQITVAGGQPPALQISNQFTACGNANP